MLETLFGGLASWGPDFLRLGAGVLFVAHGYPKLFGHPPGLRTLAQYLRSMGIPLPIFMATLVGIVEFGGGACLLLGFLTRLAALAIEFAVIIFKVKWSKGFFAEKGGWEWEGVMLMILLSLLVTGPGHLALDHRIHTGI